MRRLSLTQQAYYQAIKYYSKDYPTNSGGVLYLSKPFSADILSNAVIKCIENISELNTRFIFNNNQLFSINDNTCQYQIDKINFNNRWNQRVIDNYCLEKIPLFASCLFRVAIVTHQRRSAIIFVINHLITDGVSIKALAKGLLELLANKTPTKLASYQKYLDYEDEYLSSKHYHNDKEFWENQVKDQGSVAVLPHQIAKQLDKVINGKYQFNQQQSKLITDFTNQHGISPQVLFEAVLAMLVSYANGSNNVTLGITTHNRRRSLSDVFGLIATTLPINIPTNNDAPFYNLLQAIKHQRLITYRHQMFPYQEILKIYQSNKIKNLFETMIIYQVDLKCELDFSYHEEIIIPSTSELAVVFHVNKNNEKYHLSGSFKQSLFKTKANVAAYLDLFVTTLFKAINNPDQTLSELMKKPANNETVVVNESIVSLFTKQANNNPDVIAITQNDKHLTYQDLKVQSDLVASKLIGLKLNNQIIRINLSSELLAVVAILGVIKSNNTYVIFPLESSSLEQKYQKICNVSHTIDDNFFKDLDTKIITVDRTNPILALYLTSGTTGLAKAVRIKDCAVVNYCFQEIGFQGQLDKVSNLLNVAQMHFDISLENIFLSLLHGKTLHLANIKQLRIKNSQIDFLSTTPSVLQLLTENDEFKQVLKKLKVLVLGGEILNRALYLKLKKYQQLLIYNSYGPTEATIAVTVNQVSDNDLSLGYPYRGCNINIVNQQLMVLPRLFVGQILISGICLADYYQNSSDGFVKINDATYYQTNDFGYIDLDNKLHYLGRFDNQIKRFGVRIELDLIDRVLLEHPLVLQAKSSFIDNMIITNLTSSTTSEKVFTDYLKERLPISYLPNRININEQLVINSSGKTAFESFMKSPKIEYLPQNELQRTFVKHIKEVFKIKTFYTTDTFTDLNGDSLKALTLLYRLEASGIVIPFSKIYQIDKMASLIEESYLEQKITPTKYNFYQAITFSTNYQVILLLGATGFLGMHLLDELLRNTKARIILYLRGDSTNSKKRLSDNYYYYFNKKLELTRIKIVNHLAATYDNITINCIINCAAKVAFIGEYQDFYEANYGLVVNLSKLASKDVPIFHVSTIGLTFSEDQEFNEISDFKKTSYPNYYLHTKRLAEDYLMASNLPVYLLRVGNLMPRSYDNKFQINPEQNAIYQLVKQGLFKKVSSDLPFDYSPVDQVSQALVKIILNPPDLKVLHILNNDIDHLTKQFNLKNKKVLNNLSNQILLARDFKFTKVKLSQIKRVLASWIK